MAEKASQDRELILGTGTLLALFFGLVALCAIFFGMGYSVGRSSAVVAAAAPPAEIALASTPAGPKPVAAKPAAPPNNDCDPSSSNCDGPSAGASSNELSFFKSVQQNNPNPQLTPAQTAQPKPAATAPATPAPTAAAPSAPSSPAPELKAPQTGFIVQIAAVTKQEDAQALVNALSSKQYPVFIASNAPNDRLFRVQVGPFADMKDAEAMRQKLVADGYNAILKK